MRAPAARDSATDAADTAPAWLEAVRPRVDEELRAFLARRRAEMDGLEPRASRMIDELGRLIAAGGKRVRPALCYWGYRAAGGVDDGRIIRPAAALELLHTFAIMHDDVMDRSPIRRGVASTHVRLAGEHPPGADAEEPAHVGMSLAILAGDLAAVYADRMFMTSRFPPARLVEPRRRYDAMRIDMAAGQYLDLTAGPDADEPLARRISSLKTGSYTIRWPLLIGAALAGGTPELDEQLSAYAAPLGEAYQVRDDVAGVLEGEGDLERGRPTIVLAKARRLLGPKDLRRLAALDPSERLRVLTTSGALDAAVEHANGLVDDALAALSRAGLGSEPAGALRELAAMVAPPGPGR